MIALLNPWVLLAMLLSALALAGGGFYEGVHVTDARWQQKQDAAAAAGAKQQAAQSAATVQVVTQYVDRIQTVEKKVPVLRTRIIDTCSVRDGAATSPAMPGSASHPDAPAAGPQNTFAADLADDIQNCAGTIEQLKGLQAWVTANSAP